MIKSRFGAARKRERPPSQERASERPTKRFNATSQPDDDAPEEGELEDDDDVTPSQSNSHSLPPPPASLPPSPSKSRVREKGEGDGGDEEGIISRPQTVPTKKVVAYPFTKKEKSTPTALAPPLPAFASDSASDFPVARKDVAALPPPHPSLPPAPNFQGVPRKEPPPSSSQPSPPPRRHSPPPPPRRERDHHERERSSGRGGYDEYGRELRDWEKEDRERGRDDRYHRHHHQPADDWRTRRDDVAPYDNYRDRDRDRRGWDSSSSYRGGGGGGGGHYRPSPPRYAPRSPSPRRKRSPTKSSRSQSRSRSRSRSPSTPPRHSPSHHNHHSHPYRLPARAARPPTPPPLPDPLSRDDVTMGMETEPVAPPPARAFQPFNMPASSGLPPRPPPAPLPNYEPKSLPPSVMAAVVNSASAKKVKNVLADEEDEGEVKETIPPPPPKSKPPFLLEPIPLPAISLSKGAPLPPNEPPPPPPSVPKIEDAIARKIKEMENAATSGGGGGKVISPVKEQQQQPPPPQRPARQRRSVADEKAAYGGRVFTGVSRLMMYRKEDKLGEGTFGEVFKATHTQTGSVVALKRILMHNEFQGVPITAVREIKLLKKLKHPNVVELVDIVMELASPKDEKGSIYMVFPYMDHDLAGLLENTNVTLQPSHIKLYMKQLLEGTAYLHRNHILHRDIKAANLLINNKGLLQIADFGLARPISKEWASKRGYTNCVVTRWYRPPELLMGAKVYDGAVDMWGIGCILAEMFERKPILMGDSDMGQLDVIFQLCGSPNEGNWPGWKSLPGCEGYEAKGTYNRNIGHRFRMLTNETCDLIIALLALDPSRRLSAEDALDHPYFWTEPLPADPKNMPNWTASKEYDRRKKAEMQHQQQQQQQHQHRGPPPVHYQPQQSGFHPNRGGGHHPHHGGNPNFNRNAPMGYNNGMMPRPPPHNNGPPPHHHHPRMGDGLPPPGMTLPGAANRGFNNNNNNKPIPAALPPMRFNDNRPQGLPLPPHGPPSMSHGLPDPAFGGEKGYNGPLVRGGKHPERAYTAPRQGPGGGGGGGRRGEPPDPRARGGGALPYD